MLASFLSDNSKLRKVNNVLTVIVVFLSMYLIILPFIPVIQLWVSEATDNTNGVRYTGLLAEQNNVTDNLAKPPSDNRLVVPSISLDEQIIVGEDSSNVHLGAWLRPQTSTPDKGSNTVIVGHRFSYSSPAVFYHLDKIELGDTFAIWWQGKEYVYKVFDTEIVTPDAIRIEEPTTDAIATLYTCTPIWTAQNRLIVKGKLISKEGS
jgi:sortase A